MSPQSSAPVIDRQTMPARSPAELDKALGIAIRSRRRGLGMTQEDLAARCGISFQQVQKYENGANRISFSRLCQIAAALDCTVNAFVDALVAPSSFSEPTASALPLIVALAEPGVPELIAAYTALSPEARAHLIRWLTSLALKDPL